MVHFGLGMQQQQATKPEGFWNSCIATIVFFFSIRSFVHTFLPFFSPSSFVPSLDFLIPAVTLSSSWHQISALLELFFFFVDIFSNALFQLKKFSWNILKWTSMLISTSVPAIIVISDLKMRLSKRSDTFIIHLSKEITPAFILTDTLDKVPDF